MSQYRDNTGALVVLRNQLGRGGEGSVYEIRSTRDYVAKIYHNQILAEKAEKLSLMPQIGNSDLYKFAAWPKGAMSWHRVEKVSAISMPEPTSAYSSSLLVIELTQLLPPSIGSPSSPERR